MGTLQSAKKFRLYLIIASCTALLLTFMIVINDHQLPTWKLFNDPNEDGQNVTTHQKSEIINSSLNTLRSVQSFFSNETMIKQKSGEPLKSKKFINGNDSSFPKQLKQERSSYKAGENYLPQNVSYATSLSSGVNSKNVINENDALWTSQEKLFNLSNSKDSLGHTNVLLLADTLNNKLNSINLIEKINFKPTCESDFKLANSCDNNKCLQTELPDDVTARVEQLVTPRKLQMSPEEHQILSGMADKVVGNYDVILLTAVSSNHFMESQALLKNLHENVYPHMKNFTLVFYNLGLTEQERILMVKYCKCQVIDFPFHKFPPHLVSLKCYSWKPILIKAHLRKANIVFWMDASVRFRNSPRGLHDLVYTSRERGVRIGNSAADSSFRTYRSMYHFFGDEPCAHLNLGQAKATFGVYHREYFVDRVILEPWVACALNENCMCPVTNISADCEHSKIMSERYYQGKGPIVYGMCHRFDQSAISLILHKLYQDVYPWVTVRTGSLVTIRRKHTLVYFPSNTNST